MGLGEGNSQVLKGGLLKITCPYDAMVVFKLSCKICQTWYTSRLILESGR